MNGMKRIVGGLGVVSAALLSACAVPVGEEDAATTSDALSLATTAVPAATALATSLPRKVLNAFGTTQGWTKQDVRLFGDVDGDGDRDLVAVDETGVYFSRYKPAQTVLQTPTLSSPEFVQNHMTTTWLSPIFLGALDYDNRQDILGFGSAGVYVVFTAADSNYRFIEKVLDNFGTNQGWGPAFPRLLADVNGDGFDDIVGFGADGIWVSYSAPGVFAFTTPTLMLAEFGYNQGWRVETHLRYLADVNGDGRKDIVGFKDDGVFMSLATATGFAPVKKVLNAYAPSAGGWYVGTHPRALADVNGDGKSDIVGFGNAATYVSLSTGTGFTSPAAWSSAFGVNSGFSNEVSAPRFVVDRNGDGRADIMGFGPTGMYVATSTGSAFSAAQNIVPNFGSNFGWNWGQFLASAVDFRKNGYASAVGFGSDGVYTDWTSLLDPGNLPVFELANP